MAGELSLDDQIKLETEKAKLAEGLEERKAQWATHLEEQKAQWTTDLETLKALRAGYEAKTLAVRNAYLEVGKGVLDRARARAEFIEKAAATIGTLYTTVLGLSFVAKDHALAWYGIVPAVFLGLAIALATGYLAYLTRVSATVPELRSPLLDEDARLGVIGFLAWVTESALQRRYLLHAAIFSLTAGIVTLPVAYLDLNDLVIVTLFVVGILVIFGLPVLIDRQVDRDTSARAGDPPPVVPARI